MISALNIPFTACRIEGVSVVANLTRKVKIAFDVSSKESSSQLDEMFAGANELIQSVAAEESDAITLVKKKKPSEVNVVLKDPKTKKVIFKMVSVSCSAPILRISKSAEKVELSVTVSGHMSREEALAIDEFFKADCIGSIETAQTDIEEIAKPEKKKKAKKQKAEIEVDELDEMMQ
jgi:hypothetical protein